MNLSRSDLLCVNRIKSTYPIMTSTEVVIADYIVDHVDEIAEMSVYELASATDSSPATVSRFCKKIGFIGFQELKYGLSREWLTPDYGIPQLSTQESVSTLKQKVLMFNKRALDDMLLTLDDEALMRAALLISKAEHILFVAEGASSSSAKAACLSFQLLGLQCELSQDPYLEIARIAQLTEQDLVIGLSYSGRSRNTIDAMKLAHTRKISTIGIAGVPNTPLSKLLDVELLINTTASNDFCNSLAARISECGIFSVLYCLLVHNHLAPGSADPDEMEKILDIKRIGWNELR